MIERFWKFRTKLHYFIPYLLLLAPFKIYNHVRWLIARPDKVILDGRPFYVNKDDAGLSKDLFIDSNREPISQRLLKGTNPGDTVIDIGANLGFYTTKLSREVGDKGKVYAIEPVSDNVQGLMKNVGELKNVETKRMAVGDKTGNASISIHEKLNWSGFNIPSNRCEAVPMTTLDDFVEKNNIRPSLVRMDVEGYEDYIIKGAHTVMAEHGPRFMIEVHAPLMGRERTTHFLKMFKDAGYDIKAIAIDPLFYPNVSLNNPVNNILLWLWRHYFVAKDRLLLEGIGKVREDLAIDDLLKNGEFLQGNTITIHVLFEKKPNVSK